MSRTTMSFVDQISFLASWAGHPLRVGAIAPSGRSLADIITRGISPADAPVIELGPGTGAFTRALIARGVPEDRLVLIELGADFARTLKRRYPEASVLQINAAELANMELFGSERAGAVVSGLPLLSFPQIAVVRILKGAFAHLREDGGFYQFTYGPACPVSRPVLERFGLRAQKVGRTLANLPPASVYRISRRPGEALRF
jgi:phospholipid N-methyltransferase